MGIILSGPRLPTLHGRKFCMAQLKGPMRDLSGRGRYVQIGWWRYTCCWWGRFPNQDLLATCGPHRLGTLASAWEREREKGSSWRVPVVFRLKSGAILSVSATARFCEKRNVYSWSKHWKWIIYYFCFSYLSKLLKGYLVNDESSIKLQQSKSSIIQNGGEKKPTAVKYKSKFEFPNPIVLSFPSLKGGGWGWF